MRKSNAVVSYLKKQKVDDIEVLISTHLDAAHIGGLDEVISFLIKETNFKF